jgi:hypothetical protein
MKSSAKDSLEKIAIWINPTNRTIITGKFYSTSRKKGFRLELPGALVPVAKLKGVLASVCKAMTLHETRKGFSTGL